MASSRRINANRLNAKKSTGPKTALGKLKSSRNATRHGLSYGISIEDVDPSFIENVATLIDRPEAAIDDIQALAQALELGRRLQQERAKLLARGDLKRLAALDRLERNAFKARRNAAGKLKL
jgi:hypothetical protein